VNQFVAEKETPIPTMRVDPELERAQIERVRAVRARRDSARANAAVAEVERRARSGENLMPAIVVAVDTYSTVGEISDALRRVFGEYTESVVL
jgi:methylmalonyl-CoA mutase N-terminal domain/subunit